MLVCVWVSVWVGAFNITALQKLFGFCECIFLFYVTSQKAGDWKSAINSSDSQAKNIPVDKMATLPHSWHSHREKYNISTSFPPTPSHYVIFTLANTHKHTHTHTHPFHSSFSVNYFPFLSFLVSEFLSLSLSAGHTPIHTHTYTLHTHTHTHTHTILTRWPGIKKKNLLYTH